MRLEAILDRATAADPRFKNSVSAATWTDYRRQIVDYAEWLAERSSQWSEPAVFAAYLESLNDLTDTTLTKRCTAVNKLVQASLIIGKSVQNPTRAPGIQELLKRAEHRSRPNVEAIAPTRNYRISEAAEALSVSTRTVRRRLDAGTFPTARLEPGPSGSLWLIPGAELAATFGTAVESKQPDPPRALTASYFKQILQSIDTATAGGLRDYAALQFATKTRMSEAEISRLQIHDISNRTISLPNDTSITKWARTLEAAGAEAATTLWPAINRSDRINLASSPVRIGTIIRRYFGATNITGLAQLRSEIFV